MPRLRVKITKLKNKSYPIKTCHSHRNFSLLIYEKIKKMMNHDALPLVVTPPILIAFTSLEWWHWYQGIMTPSPIILSFTALGFSIYCFYKLRANKKRTGNKNNAVEIVNEQ